MEWTKFPFRRSPFVDFGRQTPAIANYSSHIAADHRAPKVASDASMLRYSPTLNAPHLTQIV
ncbi:hypothetical protein ACO34A_11350 [Rhizobium sp. ACO-34A]|nr:hypothetical protein ACO34A_11350 [Rhizobium sp. ACO-34A]